MTKKDKTEFRAYLQACSDNQVRGVYEKEHAAGRDDYAELAQDEAYRRQIACRYLAAYAGDVQLMAGCRQPA